MSSFSLNPNQTETICRTKLAKLMSNVDYGCNHNLVREGSFKIQQHRLTNTKLSAVLGKNPRRRICFKAQSANLIPICLTPVNMDNYKENYPEEKSRKSSVFPNRRLAARSFSNLDIKFLHKIEDVCDKNYVQLNTNVKIGGNTKNLAKPELSDTLRILIANHLVKSQTHQEKSNTKAKASSYQQLKNNASNMKVEFPGNAKEAINFKILEIKQIELKRMLETRRRAIYEEVLLKAGKRDAQNFINSFFENIEEDMEPQQISLIRKSNPKLLKGLLTPKNVRKRTQNYGKWYYRPYEYWPKMLKSSSNNS